MNRIQKAGRTINMTNKFKSSLIGGITRINMRLYSNLPYDTDKKFKSSISEEDRKSVEIAKKMKVVLDNEMFKEREYYSKIEEDNKKNVINNAVNRIGMFNCGMGMWLFVFCGWNPGFYQVLLGLLIILFA